MWRCSRCQYCRRFFANCCSLLENRGLRTYETITQYGEKAISTPDALTSSTCEGYQHRFKERIHASLISNFADEFLSDNVAFGSLDTEAESYVRPVDTFLMGLGYYDNSAEFTLDEMSANAYSTLTKFEKSTSLTKRNVRVRDGYTQSMVSSDHKLRHAQTLCIRRNHRSSRRWRMRVLTSAVEETLTNEGDGSSADDKLYDKHGSQSALTASGHLNLVPSDEIQKRTLKTTIAQKCVKPVSSPPECQIEALTSSVKIDKVKERVTGPTEVGLPAVVDKRVRVASAKVLRNLTIQRDMDGLRETLTKERWPSFRRMKTFISDLFDVVVEKSEDASEVRQFVEDFAGTNNHAYLSNTVALTILRRIVCEESIQAAISYATSIRNLFLTKPPLRFDQRLNQTAVKLFETALEKKISDTAAIQCFCDTLLSLNYIPDSTAYLSAAMKIQLKKNNYHAAFEMWTQSVRRCRTMAGDHLLFRSILLEKTHSSEKEKKLRKILDEHEKCGDVFSGLAELIMELLKADMIYDARVIMRRVKILGQHYNVPLLRLKEDMSNLAFVEIFADLLAESHLTRSKNRNIDQNSKISPFIKSILEDWQPQRKKYQKKGTKKKFKTDARQLHKLLHNVQYVWFELAENSGNKESLSRLLTWSEHIKCELSNNLRTKYEEVMANDILDL